MSQSPVTRVVDFCVRHAWWIIVLVLALGVGSGIYAARHFALVTDIDALLSPDLPWMQRAQQYARDFPRREILVVVDAPTPELTEQATSKLAAAIKARPDRFRSLAEAGSGNFFAQNGLLYLPLDEVTRLTDNLKRADALLGTLAGDPTLRGSLDALSLALLGVERGEIKLDDLTRPLSQAADTADDVLAARPASFSWRVLASGKPAEPRDLRGFIEVEPVLDFTSLQPGRAATATIAQLGSDVRSETDPRVRVRQTGRIPIDDDELGTIAQNADINATATLLVVLLILRLALRSWRIVFAVGVSLFTGLAIATAVGLLQVGALNVISVAFFALFVGLGVDFGLQFSVRYRAERHDDPDLNLALNRAAAKAGAPLGLAALATAVGFSSFLPTAYRGLSELGQIAGAGMILAFIGSITLLPALLKVLNPPGEPNPVGFAALAPVDHFLERHRIPIVAITLLTVALASPLLYFLHFDFNPLHLRSPKVESVATYLELRSDPRTGANSIDIVAPDLGAADTMAHRLVALPQVAETMTLSNFVPADQDEKLKRIADAAAAIDASLNPTETEAMPTDKDTIDALTSTAESLSSAAANAQGAGADAARRLAGLLSRLAQSDPATRQQMEATIVAPLLYSLDHLRRALKPQRISTDSLPSDLANDWMTKDGRARIQVLPNGSDPDDTATLRNFVTAVLAVAPEATGTAVLLFEAGNTVVRAFIEAGAFALCAIAVLLLIALRRLTDVLLTLVPLMLAGLVTLELCVVLDLPLNFANVLALPLLLGVGVAFKIYYIMAWRSGKTALLQSSLTRAVVFSAMTTATGFGSLWFSSHPGTSSMGKLMALSLATTMMAAVLFQPALMGPPRKHAG
jgi:uncharacterized protein